MTAKNNILRLFSYPVIRLGDSPFTRRLHRIHLHVVSFVKVSAVLVPALILAYVLFGFYVPSSIAFSTHTQNCVLTPTALPNLSNSSINEHFKVSTPAMLSINGYPLFSMQMCVEPKTVPPSGTTVIPVQQLKLPFSKKLSVTNQVALYASPVINGNAVSSKSNLVFELSKPDVFFEYNLRVMEKSVSCVVQLDTIACPTSDLALEQGEPYTFILEQRLGDTSQPLYSQMLTTIESVDLVSSSIAAGQTIYDNPTDIRLVFSKPLLRAGEVKLMQDTLFIPISYVVDGTTIVVTPEGPLERQKTFTLVVQSVNAEDGGYLEMPISIPFTMSGGPKVISSTLPSYKANPSADFVLNFDQSIRPDQDFSSLISLAYNGTVVPAAYAASGSQLRIRTVTRLPSCTDIVLTVSDKLTSSYGVSGGNAYTTTSRTQCSSAFSIGSSVEGREITAYTIGGGSEEVLFIGSIHGNEKSAFYLLNSWLDYLEANPSAIPSNKRIVIIPKLNPDGFARNSRYNAHNVDLNRNFASANWKKDVKVPGGAILENGGGTAPLSEPESQAIINYINNANPTLIMSYHSQGSIVIGNGSGNSLDLAKMYAGHVDYENVAPEASASAFEHDTTGALEDWLHETPGIPVVLLELSSHTTNSIFPYHKQPMLNVIK